MKQWEDSLGHLWVIWLTIEKKIIFIKVNSDGWIVNSYIIWSHKASRKTQVSGSFALQWERLFKQKSENCKEEDYFKFLDVKLKSGMSKTSLKTNGKLSLE